MPTWRREPEPEKAPEKHAPAPATHRPAGKGVAPREEIPPPIATGPLPDFAALEDEAPEGGSVRLDVDIASGTIKKITLDGADFDGGERP